MAAVNNAISNAWRNAKRSIRERWFTRDQDLASKKRTAARHVRGPTP
ncbi:MAG: hypothetical protein ACJAUC_004831 [Planctomycetota bacterium]|jgi:hypothetical protein